MARLNAITRLAIVLEAARQDGDHRRAQRCPRALRALGAA